MKLLIVLGEFEKEPKVDDLLKSGNKRKENLQEYSDLFNNKL